MDYEGCVYALKNVIYNVIYIYISISVSNKPRYTHRCVCVRVHLGLLLADFKHEIILESPNPKTKVVGLSSM